MKLIRHSSQLKLAAVSAVAIGNFDGLHRGHQKLISKLIADSKSLNLKSVLCTFSPLPWQVLSKKESTENLSNLRSKVSLLQQYELDIMLLVHFNQQFRKLSPAEFIKDFLVNQLNAAHVITGEDFRFAFGRKGGQQQLIQAQQAGLFSYASLAAYPDDESKISSSNIRQLLMNGDLKAANDLLGYKYFITGKVIQGRGLGKKLGFPTANLNLQKFIPPVKGVYLCQAYIGGHTNSLGVAALVNLGYRPTIERSNQKKFVAEAHILNFNENIYGKLIKLEFLEYLRPEKKFTSVDELTLQIKQDRDDGLRIMNERYSMITTTRSKS
ncbi:MAG: bifunctional riboflavin kinase/FAD synthetase [Candidatus Portiera sp.]|nr:bifunctional riboflavin kinase/FAD synthetase [Portiera sp.]